VADGLDPAALTEIHFGAGSDMTLAEARALVRLGLTGCVPLSVVRPLLPVDVG
jgi:hypothetical protein